VRRAWLVGGSAFAVVALAWGTLTVVSLLAYDSWEVHRSFDAAVRTVEVQARNGEVRLGPAPGDQLVVDIDVSRGLFDTETTEEVHGDRLVLDSHCAPLLNQYCRVDYRIGVPAGVAVVARAAGGGIDVSGVSGDLDLRATGGGIELQDASGTLRLSATGGGVSATGLTSAVVEAHSSGGGVTLGFARPPRTVAVSSSGGGVTVELPDTPDAYRVEAGSSAGTTRNEVRTDPTSDRTIDAHASGGGVTVRYPR
jgi:hypothetical protein